jgi:hypothetical protein
MLNLEVQKQLMLNMFKASIFETNQTEQSSDAVKDFFTPSKTIRQSDNVDLIASINALSTMQITKSLSKTQKRDIRNYALSLNENFTEQDLRNIVKCIDIENDTHILKQVDDIVKSKQYEKAIQNK